MLSDRFIVYGLCDPRTGELRYVGQSTRGLKRVAEHLQPVKLRNNPGRVARWLRGLVALGLKPETFVIESVASADLLNEAEQHHIACARYIGCRLTNLTNGGEGNRGWDPSPETRAKWHHPSWSAESRARISASNTKREWSPTSRRKIGAAQAGRKRPEKTKALIAEAMRGRTFSEEARARMSASAKRRAADPERRRRHSEAIKRWLQTDAGRAAQRAGTEAARSLRRAGK